MVNMVRFLTERVEVWETETGQRTRRRKKADQENFELAIETILTNLALSVLMFPSPGYLAVLTGNNRLGMTRYDNPALGRKPFRKLLFALWEMGILVLQSSSQRGEASAIAPSDTFRQLVSDRELSVNDIAYQDQKEILILTKNLYRLQLSGGRKLERTLINYQETEETTRLRLQVQALNTFLKEADISFVKNRSGNVNVNDRQMQRRFILFEEGQAPVFQYGGRLFGGFWQNLAKERRGKIRIDGEPVAVLDYSSMAPRLAYAHVGEQPPDGDFYTVPGLEQRRKAVKRAFSCLLSDNWKRQTWPDELINSDKEKDTDARMPASWPPKRLRKNLSTLHPALKDVFGQGLMFTLMFMESNILLRSLEELKARGIVGLGLHDGIMVARSRADEARKVMEQAALDIASIHIPVKVDDGETQSINPHEE